MDGLRGLTAAVAFGAFAAIATNSSASTMVNVTWGSQTANVGTVSSSGSGADFYNYANYRANVPFDLKLGTVYAFVHEQTGTGALSLGMITTGTNMDIRDCKAEADRDKCRSYLGGWMNHAPETARTTVMDGKKNVYGDEDDPSESWAKGANGRYYVNTFTNDTSGFVLDGLSVGDSVMMGFKKLTNFDNLVLVSGGEGGFAMTEFAIGSDLPKLWFEIAEAVPEQTALRSTDSPTPVPLPAGVVLMLSALGLAGFGLRSSRSV